MSFHVYLEPQLQEQVDALSKKTGRKRNAIVREALREYVAKQVKQDWPEEVFRFSADPKLTRFESLRQDSLSQRENIFQDQDE
jgi:hypothetical protein